MLVVPAGVLVMLLIASSISLVRLARPVELPEPSVETQDSARVASPPAERTEPKDPGLGAAVASDPFRSERRPASVAFRMPGEALADAEAHTPPPAQVIVLIGTAVETGGGFAMCQIGSEPPRLVRLGERLAGYTLRSVGQGRATFRTATGQLIEVLVAKAGT
jgi:hypothetical protein